MCIDDLVTSFLAAEGQVIEHIKAVCGSLCAGSPRDPDRQVENWGKDARAPDPPHFSRVAL